MTATVTKPTTAFEGDKRTGADDRGFYIRTFTGKQFYWDEIEKNEYDIRDIAHALSMNCRWTGHVKKFYSVAQHSLMCSMQVPTKHALAALLHDATEAYVHDTPSPLKWYLRERGFTSFADLEKRIDVALNKTFGVTLPRDPCIKEADLRMLATENRDLMEQGQESEWMVKPYDFRITPIPPEQAEAYFLNRYTALTGVTP